MSVKSDECTRLGPRGTAPAGAPAFAANIVGRSTPPSNPRHEKGASAQVSVVNSGAQHIQPKSPGLEGKDRISHGPRTLKAYPRVTSS